MKICLLEKCRSAFIVCMVGALVTYEKYYSMGWGGKRYYRRYEKVLLLRNQ